MGTVGRWTFCSQDEDASSLCHGPLLLLNPTMVATMEDMEAMEDMDIDMARGVLMLSLRPNPTMVDTMGDMEAMVDMDIDMARGVLMLGLLLNPTMVDIMEDMVAMEDTDTDGENKHQRH